jgi:hypothetical protein
MKSTWQGWIGWFPSKGLDVNPMPIRTWTSPSIPNQLPHRHPHPQIWATSPASRETSPGGEARRGRLTNVWTRNSPPITNHRRASPSAAKYRPTSRHRGPGHPHPPQAAPQPNLQWNHPFLSAVSGSMPPIANHPIRRRLSGVLRRVLCFPVRKPEQQQHPAHHRYRPHHLRRRQPLAQKRIGVHHHKRDL